VVSGTSPMTRALTDVEVLVLDCQATGALSSGGRLLEIGWARSSVSERRPPDAVARLIRDGEPPRIPRRVRAITGISAEELRSGDHPRRIWGLLCAAAREIARANHTRRCPTIVHYARFEEPFLRALHEESRDGAFPLELFCTHELARRLVPSLPRKGLRAVAGYFGHGVGELRRAREHVAATADVWRATVRLLDEQCGVRTLPELRAWLAWSEAPTRVERRYPMDPQLRLSLPDRPGVYRLRRSNGDVLYVGKARSLRRRVNSYFQKRAAHHERTLEMLAQARCLDVTETPSTLEAAILECDEIKRLSPPYNVALRDRGRSLAYWSVDLRAWRSEPGGAHSLGPLPSPESLAPVAALARLLWGGARKGEEESLTDSWLRLPRGREPSPESVRSGLGQLLGRHGSFSPRVSLAGAVLRLGARLERASAEENVEESGTELALEDEATPDWIPERVASAAEVTLAQGARAIRRALWIRRLSECSLVWEDGTSGRTTLRISGGEVRLDAPPVGGGGAQREGLDRACYDRLSALTRELKRLVGEADAIELRFGSRRLDREGLARTLRWV